MTFALRQISVQFSTADGAVTNLEGLRASIVTKNAGGEYPVAQLQMRIYGMTLDQMNQFSSNGANFVADQNLGVTVLAGDQGSVLGQLFAGGIFSSYIDFGSIPDVAFVVAARAGMYQQANTVAPNSWQGTQNAEDLISSLTATLGSEWRFENPQNAHAIIQNQYVYGSALNQIQKIIRVSNFASRIENNTITIYPNDGAIDDVVIDVSPDNGLVGYPTYYESGFIIRTEYNPDMLIGRTVNLTSQIPKANGTWQIFDSTHELSTLTPDGPWFTTVKLGAPGTNNVSKN